MKRTIKVTSLALACMLVLGSCGNITTPDTKDSNEVELVIGESEYTTSEINDWVLKYYRDSGITSMKRSVALEELAKQEGLDYTKAVEDEIKVLYTDEDNFEANMIAQGSTPEKERLAIQDKVIYNMLIEKYLGEVTIPEEEIVAEYNKNKAHYDSYDVVQTAIMDTIEPVPTRPTDSEGNELEVKVPEEVSEFYNLPLDQKIAVAQGVIDSGEDTELVQTFNNRYLGSSIFAQEHPGLTAGEYVIEKDENGFVNIYKILKVNSTLESSREDVVRTLSYAVANDKIQQGLQALLNPVE